MNEAKTSSKLTKSVVTIIILSICLCIVSLALIYSNVVIDSNYFLIGKVKINLNDGKPVIKEDEFIFEPGMSVEKEFFLENQSSGDVYYRFYLDHVEGKLADVLDIMICNDDVILYQGKAVDLRHHQIEMKHNLLRFNERKDLMIIFYYPKEYQNDGQDTYLLFDLTVEAVQTKNNSQGLFD